MTTGSAPGKLILFGEHAVVYGRTAIAVPVEKVRTRAMVSPLQNGESDQIYLEAPQIERASWLHDLPQRDPFFVIVRLTLDALGIDHFPPIRIQVTSTIPIAAGMGSSAATSIAIIRALSAHFNRALTPEEQSEIAFEVERIHHGTPSGIDNTVVAHGKPVIYSKARGPQPLDLQTEIPLVIGDTGIQVETAFAVAQVRERWQANTSKVEHIFDQISALSDFAAAAIQSGRIAELGPLMNQNQSLLEEIGVSSDPLESLIGSALKTGALGAKLSGAGLGGNMIALVQQETSHQVANALREAGAVGTIETVISR